MSMHMAVSGMSSRQRATFQAKAKRERLEAVLQDLGELEEGEAGSELDGNAHTADWASHTSLQNLAGCYKMWCNKG